MTRPFLRRLVAPAYRSFKGAVSQVRFRYLKVRYGAVHVGKRAVTGASVADQTVYRKQFLNGAAEQPMAAELLARAVFADRPWIVPIVRAGPRWIEMPRMNPNDRLDLVLAACGTAARQEIARQAIAIALDVFSAGFAHRDFHARNLFWDGRQLRLVDFETMIAYPEGERPAFQDSYDFTGSGLPSPFMTQNMGFMKEHPCGLAQLLGLDRETALSIARDLLVDRLRQATATFNTVAGRHECRAGRIYGSFTLPAITVSPEVAQRDSAKRLRNFGILPEHIAGQSCLDIGCNVGAMLFELQRHAPRTSLGLEYDQEKVDAARAVAAFAGLSNLRFEQADVDALEAGDLGTHDNVFCLALIEHLQRREHLYDLLGRVTARRLFFEGNSGTSVDEVQRELLRVGFSKVEALGISDDDCRAENNRRPLLVATK